MSLDDIWNEHIASPPRPAPQTDDAGALKRPHQSLFFSDSDSDYERPPKRAAPALTPARPDVDALFDDLDDDVDDDLRYKPLAPSLDVAKLAKEAEARHAKQTASSQASGPFQTGAAGGTVADPSGKDGGKGKSGSGDGGKLGRKVLPKLDEERLVGSDGFPLLVRDIDGFKPKGKGHEHTDLNRLLQVYQFWSHRMYPKMAFKDTIDRVERLCHSKRMKVRLSVWRDEFEGITKDTKSTEDTEVIDLTEPTPVVTENDEDDKGESEPPPVPLSPMRTSTTSPENGPNVSAIDADDDTSLWDALDDPQLLLDPPPSTPPSSAPGGDDDDMWDVVDEIMMEHSDQRKPKPTNIQIPVSGVNLVPSSDPTTSGDAPRATNDDDLDDMYS